MAGGYHFATLRPVWRRMVKQGGRRPYSIRAQRGSFFRMAYRDELARKAIHLLSAGIPIGYVFLSRPIVLAVVGGLVVIAFVIEHLRQRDARVGQTVDSWFGRMLRTAEHRGVSGATWVVVGAWLSVLLFPRDVAIAVLFILSISDSLASLVGRKFGTVRFLDKSLAGSGAFFLSALLIAYVVLTGAPLRAVIGAGVATLAEALPLRVGTIKLDDNLAIPLLSGAALVAADVILGTSLRTV